MISSAVAASRPSLDRESFVKLVTPVLPAAHRLAYGMLGNGTDAEDAVQTALLKAWRAKDLFRAGSEPQPWLLTIVANECRQQLRSPWWRVLRATKVSEPSAPQRSGPEELIELRQKLAELPADLRLGVVLRYYLDLPYDEVARIMRISPPGARSRVHRALERLRVEIADEAT